MNRFSVHAVAACVVLALAIWLSSGTLTPYGATAGSYPLEPCHYLVNVDNVHHVAPFYMLMGAPPRYWMPSNVLRRILYPLIAYPFVRALGILAGGAVCNFLITAAAMLVFARFVRARFGNGPAIATLWLLATYPGITYWAGLPYSYAAIVPACLIGAMQLYRLDAAERVRDVVVPALVIGVLLLAYDLFPFFVPALVLVLLARRKPLFATVAVPIAIIPMVISGWLLSLHGVPALNPNTATYFNIIRAYLHPQSISAWGADLLRLPLVLVANYFDSNFLVLPLLALVALVACRTCIGRVEGAILLAVLAVFLFNNAAPPYYGWQLRGVWIARLYQPMFVALLLIVVRALAAKPSLHPAITFAVLANVLIILGPLTANPAALYIDWRFYQHAPSGYFAKLLDVYGRRPLGVCRAEHDADRGLPMSRELMFPPRAFRFEPIAPKPAK